MKTNLKKEAVGAFALIALFILAIVLSNKYEPLLLEIFEGRVALGMIVYVLLGIVATVIAPISTLPILPVASVIWGPLSTAVLSIISWSIGAFIAFSLARTWGAPLVSRFVNMERIRKYERRFGQKNIFWSVVLLRITVPVDALSYALGLFSSITLSSYMLATIIGITPFAFIFSYASEASSKYQIFALFIAALAMALGMYKMRELINKPTND